MVRHGVRGVLLLALWAAPAWGQTSVPGSLSALVGRVVDPSHLPVAGVAVALEDRGRNRTHVARTDPLGRFEARDLPAADYEVEVSVPGFEVVRRALLIAGPLVDLEVVLDVGRLSETITIAGTASRPVVRRDRATGETCVPRVDATTQSPTGGLLRPPRMVSRTMPLFPAHLNDALVDGEVRFEGRIGIEGVLTELNLVSATHPDFAAAAETAVREWTWESPLLNCAPVEVGISLDVRFTAVPRD